MMNNEQGQIKQTKKYHGPAMHAIILAGVQDTYFRSPVDGLPRCMALVAGRPFLFYVINELRIQGIQHIIFSLGYKHEIIEDYLANEFPALSYECMIAKEPLGTGGATRFACEKAISKNVLVVDSERLFKADIEKLFAFHQEQEAECTIALKPMRDFDHYGAVALDVENTIIAFYEKQYFKQGLVNSAMYILEVAGFLEKKWPSVFSFENDYLKHYLPQGKMKGVIDDSYYLDTSIKANLERAQLELKRTLFNAKAIDKSWTLFLDRDGVINHDKVGSYIFEPAEFKFYDGVPKAMKFLSEKFGRVIIATNQRGVGRGLMSVMDLDNIHAKMRSGIELAGGRVDAIFYATSINNDDFERKPNPGMAIKAKTLYPGIDYNRSVMVGNNISDMQFGRNAGMFTVFLETTQEMQHPHMDIDVTFKSLADFAKAL